MSCVIGRRIVFKFVLWIARSLKGEGSKTCYNLFELVKCSQSGLLSFFCGHFVVIFVPSVSIPRNLKVGWRKKLDNCLIWFSIRGEVYLVFCGYFVIYVPSVSIPRILKGGESKTCTMRIILLFIFLNRKIWLGKGLKYVATCWMYILSMI